MGASYFRWKRIKALQRLLAMSPAPWRWAGATGKNLLKSGYFGAPGLAWS